MVMRRHCEAPGAWGVLIFVAATLTKAWEPLAVAYAHGPGRGGYPFLFPTALVLCEALKLAVCELAQALKSPSARPSLLTRSSALDFGVPAAFLAVTNHALGAAVPLLDPILYQVVFKVLSVLTTGILARVWLRAPLTRAQWLALIMLLVGFFMALPAHDDGPDGAARPKSARRTATGLIITAVGALCFAIQAVWFERSSSAGARQPVLQQTACFAAWGLVANLALLLPTSAAASVEAGGNPLHGFTVRACGAVAAIAAADLAMAPFFRALGANAYSFSRVLAMLVSTLMAVALLGSSAPPRTRTRIRVSRFAYASCLCMHMHGMRMHTVAGM